MSHEHLLELGEFYKEPTGDMIPERDSDHKSRPKPKPRFKTSNSTTSSTPKLKKRLSKISAGAGGTINSSFLNDDENENDMIQKYHHGSGSTTWMDHHKQNDTFDISSSDDSIAPTIKKRTPISIVSTVEVHSFDDHDRSSEKSNNTMTDQEQHQEETSFHIENEIKKKPVPPKPKPRLKSSIDLKSISNTNSSENNDDDKSNISKIPLKLLRSYSSSSSQSPSQSQPSEIISIIKEDYLSITIPENKIEIEKPQPSTSITTNNNRSDAPPSFMGIMRKARDFLSNKPISLPPQSENKINLPTEITTPSLVEPSPFIQENPGIKSSKFKKSDGGDEQEQFEMKLIQKRKNIKKTRDDTEQSEIKSSGVIIGPSPGSSLQSTPSTTNSKRNKRRYEIQSCITKLIGVTIHNCDMLPPDPNILHPLVKVTIMDQNGLYMIRSDMNIIKDNDDDDDDEAHLNKNKLKIKKSVTNIEEGEKNTNDDNNRKDGSKLKFNRNKNKKSGAASLKQSSILPIMTQTFENNRQIPSFAPVWNELLIFEEPFDRFINNEDSSTTILFFEIMDFLPMNNSMIRKKNWGEYHGNEAGWYKIAWGFLKPVGTNGIRNVNRKLRLQLYKPEPLSASERTYGPEIFCWWKLQKRIKINATLYVTLKGVTPPSGAAASLRTLLTMRKEHLTQAILDSQLATGTKPRRKNDKMVEKKLGSLNLQKPQWTRHEGQSCKIPNKLILSLPSSQVASLNLTVCGNVHSVKFSPCGLKLAAGLHTDELHTILIFEIPSGKLLKNLRGHHGLIYDLDWKSIVEDENRNPTYNYLASASADSTVLVWKLGFDDLNCHLVKTFLHPSFVYCVKFHPIHQSLIATGCFDYIIRIWDFSENVPSTESSPQHKTTPLILLDRHFNFVNCIAFQTNGELFFSGDGDGCLYKWKITSLNKKKWRLEQNIKFNENIKRPINDIVVHPSGNRLLVHVRDSFLKIIDINSFLILHTITGLVNEKLQIRSCMSPCGNLILSGSENSTLCIWDADTGRIIEFITPNSHTNCIITCVDYHPYDHYVVIGLSSIISEPNPIIVYTYVPPPNPDILPISTVVKLKSNLHHHHHHAHTIDSMDQLALKRTVQFAPTRGDSTEKFIKIIKKLDTALKIGGNHKKFINDKSHDIIEGPAAAADQLQIIGANEEIILLENNLINNTMNTIEKKLIPTPIKPRRMSIPTTNISNKLEKIQVEEWSLSSISQISPTTMTTPSPSPKPRKDKNIESPLKTPSSSPAPITILEKEILTNRNEIITTPESDSITSGISSKREKRRKQLQEKIAAMTSSNNNNNFRVRKPQNEIL